MAITIKGRMLKAGGWNLARRIIKPVPIVGAVVAVGLAGYVIKKKGLLRGVLHVGLDVTPVLGTAKTVVEIFTGDLIPDKSPGRQDLTTEINRPRIDADTRGSEPNQ